MNDAERAYEDLREHVDALEANGTIEKVDLSRELVIECPEDGRQVAHRFRCPKCGGEWVIPPAKRIDPTAARKTEERVVRAKFYVVSKSVIGGDNGTRVTLAPVIHGSQENVEFFRWTPGGQISLDTVNDAAAEQFTEGAEYYVDFTKAGE